MEQAIPPKKNINHLITEFLQRAADKIGATMLIEPEWEHVGQIIYPSGIRRYFRLSTLDINTMGASEIARDKGYARFFLETNGYPIPTGQTFLSPKWAARIKAPERGGVRNAWAYAKSVGLPVFVKPNSLSQGRGVSKTSNRDEFFRAARGAMRADKVIVVEKAVPGQDYRLVVLDGKVISAYERIPLRITGEGDSTVTQLLDKKQSRYAASGRETVIDHTDFRLLANLKKLDLTFDSVLESGRTVQLLDNANLSSGGTSVDVTDKVHPEFQKLAANIAFDMGLRLVGVDLMIDGDISQPPEKDHHWCIEINSAPGLDHYAMMGDKQRQIVDDLYLQVVTAMERRQEGFNSPDLAQPESRK